VQPHAASTIVLDGKRFRFSDGFPGVDGDVHSLLAADNKLFVVTRQGSIYCFGEQPSEVVTHRLATQPLERPLTAGASWQRISSSGSAAKRVML
jgi:hypothetical protein